MSVKSSDIALKNTTHSLMLQSNIIAQIYRFLNFFQLFMRLATWFIRNSFIRWLTRHVYGQRCLVHHKRFMHTHFSLFWVMTITSSAGQLYYRINNPDKICFFGQINRERIFLPCFRNNYLYISLVEFLLY